jgi:hypothetical protein
MSKEALKESLKEIMAQARNGDVEASYDGYRNLFGNPIFAANTPQDQRSVLKLLILAKRHGQPSEKLVEAHRAAIPALTELVSTHNDPEDYEMLGVCWLLVGNEEAASNMLRQGLALERERNPQSDLCGRLMTRISQI